MNTRTQRFRFLIVSLLVALALAVPGLALGQPESTPAATPEDAPRPVFGASPAGEADLAPFRLEIAPGETVETTLVVTNDGEAPVELHTYPADIRTAINGGYEVIPEEPGRAPGVAAWLTLAAAPYTLEPGEAIDIAVAVSVPEDAVPGEYMAAIATATTGSAAMAGTDAFRQISRKVNAVVIAVPGPVEAGLAIGLPALELSEDATTITVPIENTGNARVRPAGTIVIATEAGVTLAEIPVAMGSVYAWHATVIQAVFSPALPEGDYIVSVDLTDEGTGVSASLPATTVAVRIAE